MDDKSHLKIAEEMAAKITGEFDSNKQAEMLQTIKKAIQDHITANIDKTEKYLENEKQVFDGIK